LNTSLVSLRSSVPSSNHNKRQLSFSSSGAFGIPDERQQ